MESRLGWRFLRWPYRLVGKSQTAWEHELDTRDGPILLGCRPRAIVRFVARLVTLLAYRAGEFLIGGVLVTGNLGSHRSWLLKARRFEVIASRSRTLMGCPFAVSLAALLPASSSCRLATCFRSPPRRGQLYRGG
jgi:hypothetical protein